MRTDITFNGIKYQTVYTGDISCENCDLKKDVICHNGVLDLNNYCDLGYIYKRLKNLREDKIKRIFS